MRRLAVLMISSLAFVVLGCQGVISDAANSPGGGVGGDRRNGGPNGAPGSEALCRGEMSFADETPLRLLTRTQYNNTVADLFGIDSAPMRVNVEAGGDLFDTNAAGLNPTASATEHFEEIAPAIAAEAMGSGAITLACPDVSCVRTLVADLGRRMFRRPVTEDELGALVALYDTLRGADIGDTPEAAAEGVVTAMLQMPGFLYRAELGGPSAAGGVVVLSGYEIASRLSFFLWSSTPPDELLDAAEAGELDDADGIGRWAEWLLDHESGRARKALSRFNEQWLGIEDESMSHLAPDAELFPAFSPALASSMRKESLALLEDLTFDSDGTFGDAFDADYTFVDGQLAAFYGIDGVSGDALTRVELDPSERSGVLTHASLLSVRSKTDRENPIARGVFIARKVLCADLGAPPPGVAPLAEEAAAGGTLRDQLELHSQNPCAYCHRTIDPLGLGFEEYDAIGAFRTTDPSGLPVDASGSVEIDGEEVSFDDGRELSSMLATSPAVRECVTRKLAEYGVGRSMSRPEDRCLSSSIAGDEHQSIRTTILRIVTSDVFRSRRRPTPEVCP